MWVVIMMEFAEYISGMIKQVHTQHTKLMVKSMGATVDIDLVFTHTTTKTHAQGSGQSPMP